jgi:hypothetical protein
VNQIVDKPEDERPIARHYVLVLVVEALVLTTLWLLSRAYS